MGGQFDPVSGAIEFLTRYSGDYTIEENRPEIFDINQLTDEEKNIIEFMVSKGFFSLDNGNFNPDKVITRGHIVVALTRMFFALDESAKTTFTDVPESSYLYPFVASAQKENILSGINETTFAGEQALTKTQIVALCARVLRERKGYVAINNPDEFLQNFDDKDKIPDWAKSDIALAVREGFSPKTGSFSEEEEITRKQAAIYVHKLYSMLYEVQPALVSFTSDETAVDEAVTVETMAEDSSDSPNKTITIQPFIILGVIVLIIGVAGGVAGYVLSNRKKSKISNNVVDGSAKCPACGSPNNLNELFCGNCGSKL